VVILVLVSISIAVALGLSLVVVALVRNLGVLSASLKRYRDEVNPLLEKIRTEATHAQRRLEQLPEARSKRPGDRIRG
jgi:predicted PurR-regulated permease PerM